ncbi:peptidase S8 family protein, Pr1J [Metarhizium robertsii]|uniref:Peptidase S8/S53, subtilisin/kexin/sedolisin n=3 Tax=Metarhizium TaxID=5529 RepID=E9EQQ6_METRA|nr:Peptidase S8/S53, subtilisin/kexin/sedolisin [Metarhizium robertsii ARSEF 23]EFZ02826.1 Peptidase S8/S53, subtilisin/kexin/sedolisin [Metarhizium robertsii ARSEF 23]EXV06069.1 peptidase S8 family protein, Pr1J [Metarhizium robertsii]CAB63908.1 Subtilisin-like serine protease PR1J [Metarhizium anisopliae]
MFSFKTLASLLVAALPLGNATPQAGSAANLVPDKYIVTLKDGISANDFNFHMNWVRDVQVARAGHRRGLNFRGVEKTYGVGNFNAYAGHFDEHTLEAIRRNADVESVEQQQVYHLHELTTQKESTHGLATISHREPGSTEYVYDSSAGEGSTVYVLDSGIQVDHPEFEGRAIRGYNAVKDATDEDVQGHGTHVAGIVGSKTYGVAKKTKLVDVKMFHDAGSTNEIILDGIEWTIKDITAKQIQNRTVVNMSFGGGNSTALNKIIKTAYDAGILCVISSGNVGVDASDWSPASSPDGITVGAIDANWRLWDHSNHGPVVHILAPGVDVLSLAPGNETKTGSGTSQAAPHVAGLAAYLAVAKNINTAKELKATILSLGTRDKATAVKDGTVNLVAYNGII